MKVFKFGGASVKDADAVRNVLEIVKRYQGEKIAIVISAMGKNTNAFERVWQATVDKNAEAAKKELKSIRQFHETIAKDLFGDIPQKLELKLATIFSQVKEAMEVKNYSTPDYLYDQIVSAGELLSTTLVSVYLEHKGVANKWFDARNIVKTDYNFREARVDWQRTQTLVDQQLKAFFDENDAGIVMTQGFLGGADALNTTTLGREGSDYSAAILAYALNAEGVYIWKDVPGVLNADPKFFPTAKKLGEISYKEAIELAYYGASVIHPKTIKPLQNKNIPLWVKSFVDPTASGTLIQSNTQYDASIPSFIFKTNQRLLSLATRDFSFVVEDNLSEIFKLFADFKVKINMMQNSAINFSVAVDDVAQKIEPLIEALSKNYLVRFNSDLELLTIRHYNQEIIDELTAGKQVLMEQRTRQTYRVVLKDCIS